MKRARALWIAGLVVAVGLGALAYVGSRPSVEPRLPTDLDSPPAAPAEPVASADEGGLETAPDEGATEGAKPRAAEEQAEPTIEELILQAVRFDGETVELTGTILTQCNVGCQFTLNDGTGVIGVQLEGNARDRLLPLGVIGRTITVRGVFIAFPRPNVVVEDRDGWTFVR